MAEVNRFKIFITLAFFTLINIDVSKSVGYKAARQEGNCRWIQEDGYGIDLSPLEHYNTGNGFITYADDRVVYFYHPCSDIAVQTKNKNDCSLGCSLCFFKAQSPSAQTLDIKEVLQSEVNGSFYKLAHAGNAVFQPSGSDINIVFRTSYSSTIILQCNSDSSASTTLSLKDPKQTVNSVNHTLILNSPYSCLRNLTHEKHYISGWGIFFIILLTIAAAYFFGGMLVLKHIKGATGTEMIPNYDFWSGLCGQIKSCFMRLIGRGSQGADSYERI